MVILKFAMVLFLLGLILLTTIRSSPGALSGGPYYYAAPANDPNPVGPRWRRNLMQVKRLKAWWEAWYDSRGRLVELRRKEAGVEQFRVTYLWGPGGRLRARQWSQGGRVFRIDP